MGWFRDLALVMAPLIYRRRLEQRAYSKGDLSARRVVHRPHLASLAGSEQVARKQFRPKEKNILRARDHYKSRKESRKISRAEEASHTAHIGRRWIAPTLPVTAMKWSIRKRVALGALAPFLLLAAPLVAQDTPIGPEGTQVATEQTPAAAVNTDALRKAAQNPVASLISVPVQDNFNGGITPGDTTQNVLNIQPVIPVKFSENWNLIIRWITPIVYQPLGLGVGVSGLGDMQPTFLLSPSKPHKLIWGAGPIVQVPTATSRYTGQGNLPLDLTSSLWVCQAISCWAYWSTTSGPSPVGAAVRALISCCCSISLTTT